MNKANDDIEKINDLSAQNDESQARICELEEDKNRLKN